MTATDEDEGKTTVQTTSTQEPTDTAADALAAALASTLHINEEDNDAKDQEETTTSAAEQQPQAEQDKNDAQTRAWQRQAPEPLRRVAAWIQAGVVQRLLVLSGAGVSVAAGIPDFRTPGSGLYDNLAAYDLPYPEAVFDVKFYKRSPMPFVKLAAALWPGSFVPTLTHSFVTLLHVKGLLVRCYTQNIDGLEHLGESSCTVR